MTPAPLTVRIPAIAGIVLGAAIFLVGTALYVLAMGWLVGDPSPKVSAQFSAYYLFQVMLAASLIYSAWGVPRRRPATRLMFVWLLVLGAVVGLMAGPPGWLVAIVSMGCLAALFSRPSRAWFAAAGGDVAPPSEGAS